MPGCALRMGKAGVRMRLKVMAASGESGIKRTAGRLPRPDWFPPSPRRAQKKRDVRTPGPDDLLEEFNRGFAFDERIRQEFDYDHIVEQGFRRRCQSKIDYFAQASESYFATVDFPGFFGIKPSGSTHFPGIQKFALTVPPRGR